MPQTHRTVPLVSVVGLSSTVCLLCSVTDQPLCSKYLCSAQSTLLTPLSRRYIGPSTVFGSSGKFANVEQWRCVSILRSHSGGKWAALGGRGLR